MKDIQKLKNRIEYLEKENQYLKSLLDNAQIPYDNLTSEKDAEKFDYANTDDSWKEEVDALREICVINGIDPLVERSRSGRGAHLWIFFQKKIEERLPDIRISNWNFLMRTGRSKEKSIQGGLLRLFSMRWIIVKE